LRVIRSFWREGVKIIVSRGRLRPDAEVGATNRDGLSTRIGTEVTKMDAPVLALEEEERVQADAVLVRKHCASKKTQRGIRWRSRMQGTGARGQRSSDKFRSEVCRNVSSEVKERKRTLVQVDGEHHVEEEVADQPPVSTRKRKRG
jgi:hypothetical protein